MADGPGIAGLGIKAARAAGPKNANYGTEHTTRIRGYENEQGIKGIKGIKGVLHDGMIRTSDKNKVIAERARGKPLQEAKDRPNSPKTWPKHCGNRSSLKPGPESLGQKNWN